MATDKIVMWAEAKRLGIADYRKLSQDELAAAIKTAKRGGSAPAAPKGKTPAVSTNGTKGKTAGKAAVTKGKTTATKTTAAKGKTTAKPSPAKSTARKTTATKGRTAAQGTAKRAATGSGKSTPARGKATAAKSSSTRGRTKDVESYVSRIDNKKVNWKAESSVGTSGKRKTVLDALREFKGDKDKAFAKVKRHANKWYPDHENALGMVRWLVGRVALDFVKSTGQHESGVRAAYGTSTETNNVRRREARAAKRKPTRKATGGRKTAATSRGKSKSAPARGKAASGRTAAPKGKSKTAAKGKGRR